MKERYKDDASIMEMRKKVEEYAERAYGLKPEHLVAMVYSPFTDRGKNLHRYLQHLADSGYPNGNALRNSARTLGKVDNLYTGRGTFAPSPGKDINTKPNVTFFGR